MQHSAVPFSLTLASHADDVSLPSFLNDKPHSFALILGQDQGRTAQD